MEGTFRSHVNEAYDEGSFTTSSDQTPSPVCPCEVGQPCRCGEFDETTRQLSGDEPDCATSNGSTSKITNILSIDSSGATTTTNAIPTNNSHSSESAGYKAQDEPESGRGSSVQSGDFTIKWRKLDYVVESNWYQISSQRKPILNALSGSFKSGELSAVLGPSGAGKSTLIDCLMGKRERGLSGMTRVEFDDPKLEQWRRKKRPLKIALIPQQDHLLDSLTVTETFMYASKIKNAHITYETEDAMGDGPTTTTTSGSLVEKRRRFDHFANVQRVIQQLNLSSCANSRCGDLSGGQYKRVSIGQELLSRPDIMILDEPTSGLDSVTCYQTVNALRQLIDTSPYPMAIVATIHQPDIDVFKLFHKAYVLASGGRAIYEGPTDGIFNAVRLGLELVDRRQSRPIWEQASSADAARNLVILHDQLEDKNINPARLIVEVAANEYGFHITSAMNEIQKSAYDMGRGASSNDIQSMYQIMELHGSTPGSAKASHLDLVSFLDKQPSTRQNAQINMEPQFDYESNNPMKRRADLDKLLCLVSANMNQKRGLIVHLKHMLYHTQRSWITIVRDPMLFTIQVILHIFVPMLISYAFPSNLPIACPILGDLDVVDEAYSSRSVLDVLNLELRAALENLGYMFFQIYVIIFAAVCVTSLTYPLAMHVLLKEYRNGWYSMSSYFIGRTLADLPVPTFNVALAMFISYTLTGQPTSPYAWRFISVATLTILATLVAQTQGLMFGAFLMNAPQSAVFVAPASTAPLVVVSGFLMRIQSLPVPLQFLTQFSYFTHLLNGFIISIYGYGRCPCSEEDFLVEPEHKVPDQAKGIINLWLETFKQDYPEADNITSVDVVEKLVRTISKAKTFGHQMDNCSQVKPFPMLDYHLSDDDLKTCFAALVIMLIVFRWMTYFALSWKISSSV